MALKAAYRLLSNPKTTHESVLQPHVAVTRVEVRAVTTESVAPRDVPGRHAPQAATLAEVRELEPPADAKPMH